MANAFSNQSPRMVVPQAKMSTIEKHRAFLDSLEGEKGLLEESDL